MEAMPLWSSILPNLFVSLDCPVRGGIKIGRESGVLVSGCRFQLFLGEARSGEVRLGEVRTGKVSSGEVSPHELRAGEVGLREVRLGEVCPSEGRPREVRLR